MDSIYVRDLEVIINGSGHFDIQNVSVFFSVESTDSGVRSFFSHWPSVYFTLDNLPPHIRTAIESLRAIGLSKLENPTIQVLGQNVHPINIDIRHLGYRVDVHDKVGTIKLSGYYEWAIGKRTNIDQELFPDEMSPDEQRPLPQIRPWARTIAEQHVESELKKALNCNLPVKISIDRPSVFISYKRTEGDIFAYKLFHRIGKTRLLLPHMDYYDLGPGQWLSELERLISDSQALVAIITPNYESGNISQLERNLSILQARSSRAFNLVPIFLSTEATGFLKTFNGVDFQSFFKSGDNVEFERQFAHLLDLILGNKTNPYA